MDASRKAPGKCCENTPTELLLELPCPKVTRKEQPASTHQFPASPCKAPGPLKSPLSDAGASKESFPLKAYSRVGQSCRGLPSLALRGLESAKAPPGEPRQPRWLVFPGPPRPLAKAPPLVRPPHPHRGLTRLKRGGAASQPMGKWRGEGGGGCDAPRCPISGERGGGR